MSVRKHASRYFQKHKQRNRIKVMAMDVACLVECLPSAHKSLCLMPTPYELDAMMDLESQISSDKGGRIRHPKVS